MESMEEFMRRYKLECKDVKGAPECMKISGFMHRITNPELIKRLHDKILKSVDEMMRVTTAFLKGVVAASSRERKKSFSSWKQQEAGQKQNFKKGGFRNQQRSERKQDRNASKFCEFHGEVGHTTDECMHLKRQIEEILKTRKLSHLIKELKQSNGKDQAKAAKNGNLGKEQTASNPDDTIMAGGEEDGTEGPMVIEAEMGGHFLHRIYVNGGSSSEIMYEHFFNRFHPKVRNQMVPATTPLAGFSEELIWPLGKISLLQPVIDQVTEEKIQVAIQPEYPEQTIAIGSTLTEEGRKEMCGLLRHNLDIFAWKPADMTGVPHHIAEHSMHAGPRSVVAKALRSGYYWPTMHADAMKLIRECNSYQIHRPMLRNRQQNLTPITSPWPFYNNGETPISLTYGTEAMILVEIGMPTLRTAEVNMIKNDEVLEINLDLLEERREQEAIQEAKSKAKMEKYYNARVRNTSFKPRDLVYWNNDARHAEDEGKLGPKWEGPYEVMEALGKGAYKLRDRNGNILP
nr:reverse transcriptase domain-containing protein [Tanacetum cinerariifolium]